MRNTLADAARSAPESSVDVAIVGAGVAGLAAARELHRAGLSIQVVEARDRMGGRIDTVHDVLPTPIELGAEFVHGSAEETVRLIREARLTLCDIDGEHWASSRGRLMLQLDDFWEKLERVMRRLGNIKGPDKSFADFLDAKPGGPKLSEERALARQWVRGFHAADPDIASAKALADGGSPGDDPDEQRQGRILEGQDAIIRHLARETHEWVYMSSAVTRVAWEPGAAMLSIRDQKSGLTRSLAARAVVITVPHGVLAAPAGSEAAITFEPGLEKSKGEALRGLAMGAVVRVTVVLDEPFWLTKPPRAAEGRSTRQLAFVHASDGSQPVCWTSYPMETPAVVAWYGGPDAAALSRQSAPTIEAHAVASVAQRFHISRRRLERLVSSIHTHDWNRDPYSLGAYSYVAVGGTNASKQLARPLRNTLFFAGEAADTQGRNGTVEGAFSTGLRAAKEIRKALATTARRGRKESPR